MVMITLELSQQQEHSNCQGNIKGIFQTCFLRQNIFDRITENTSHGSGQGKEGEKSGKSSPDRKSVHVEINKAFHNDPPAKNSLHIEVNLPLPPAASSKQSSSSPEVKETTGKILQLNNSDGAGSSKPCVVIPPPPKEIVISLNSP